MDAIMSAIIGALLAPFVTLWAKKVVDNRKNITLSNARQNALNGKWEGMLYYDSDGNDTLAPHSVAVEITAGKRVVSGIMSYTSKGGYTTVKAVGGFVNDTFLKFEFKNKDPKILHFGTSVLELSPDACRLIGRFISYGRVTGRINTGRFELVKSP